MLTESDIEKFYADFEGMKLVKPVATMAAAAGLSTGNASEYLSRKKKPSAKFIKAFYDKVYKTSINVPRDTVSPGNNGGIDFPSIIASLMEKQNSLMQMQNKLLDEMKTEVKDRVLNINGKVNKIETDLVTIDANLDQALGGVLKLGLQVDSARTVALKSLARLEKKSEGSLIEEADKIVDHNIGGRRKRGM
jgi:hypothetical protein